MLCVTDRDFRPGMETPHPHLYSSPEVPFEVLSLQEPSVSRCVFCTAPPDPCRGTSKTKNLAARQASSRPHEAASLSREGRRKSPTQALTAIHFLLGLVSGALRDGGRSSNQPNPMWGWRRGKTTAGKRGGFQV